jgi:hypothetical protein
MPTNRTPIHRPPRTPRFTPAALDAFRQMLRLERECCCEPIDWDKEYWNHKQCAACDQWWEQHSVLRKELQTKPWQWPCVERPGAGSDLEAQARYRELEAALEPSAQ